MSEEFVGVKTIQIDCQTRYPIVSSYEFDFLKEEEVIKKLLKPCTIYFIIQRPVLYFSNFRSEPGVISFEIVDGTSTPPLKCRFIPSDSGFCKDNEELDVKIEFYKKKPDEVEPYNDIAIFQLYKTSGDYLGWFSPNVILYGLFAKTLKIEIHGPIKDYIDYQVHYIGQAFDQDIWDRLTGHKKQEKILIREDPLNSKNLKLSYEVALLMLDIEGFTEGTIYPYMGFSLPSNVKPIFYKFTFDESDPRFVEYNKPQVTPDAVELTNEVEASLVSAFKPKYNEIAFKNYPKIKSGTRSLGYSNSSLFIQKMPAILYTETLKITPIFPEHITDAGGKT